MASSRRGSRSLANAIAPENVHFKGEKTGGNFRKPTKKSKSTYGSTCCRCPLKAMSRGWITVKNVLHDRDKHNTQMSSVNRVARALLKELLLICWNETALMIYREEPEPDTDPREESVPHLKNDGKREDMDMPCSMPRWAKPLTGPISYGAYSAAISLLPKIPPSNTAPGNGGAQRKKSLHFEEAWQS